MVPARFLDTSLRKETRYWEDSRKRGGDWQRDLVALGINTAVCISAIIYRSISMCWTEEFMATVIYKASSWWLAVHSAFYPLSGALVGPGSIEQRPASWKTGRRAVGTVCKMARCIKHVLPSLRTWVQYLGLRWGEERLTASSPLTRHAWEHTHN